MSTEKKQHIMCRKQAVPARVTTIICSPGQVQGYCRGLYGLYHQFGPFGTANASKSTPKPQLAVNMAQPFRTLTDTTQHKLHNSKTAIHSSSSVKKKPGAWQFPEVAISNSLHVDWLVLLSLVLGKLAYRSKLQTGRGWCSVSQIMFICLCIRSQGT